MKVVVISDLHLESHHSDIPPCLIEELHPSRCADSDTLAIAGDLCTVTKFIEKIRSVLIWLKKSFRHVLYCPGNHEYDEAEPQTVDELLTNLCQECGVIFMQKKIWIHPSGVVFLGCTLWSMITCPSSVMAISEQETQQANHQNHIRWLHWALRLTSDRPAIVLTHYPPSTCVTSIENASRYATDCWEGVIKFPNLIGWIAGHVHVRGMWLLGQRIPLIINAIGPRRRRTSMSNASATCAFSYAYCASDECSQTISATKKFCPRHGPER
jgi:Icc-related predicted phosphoesterase